MGRVQNSPKIRLSWKSRKIYEKINCHFFKKSEIKKYLCLIGIIFPESFPHPDNYSWEISHGCLSRRQEPTKKKIFSLCLCHTIFKSSYSCMCHKQKKLSVLASYCWCFFLEACFSSCFNRSFSRSSSGFKVFSLGCLVVGSSLIRRKRKLAKVTTCCHSLSPVFTCCNTRCHLLLITVIRCTTRCHSMYHSFVFL